MSRDLEAGIIELAARQHGVGYRSEVSRPPDFFNRGGVRLPGQGVAAGSRAAAGASGPENPREGMEEPRSVLRAPRIDGKFLRPSRDSGGG